MDKISKPKTKKSRCRVNTTSKPDAEIVDVDASSCRVDTTSKISTAVVPSGVEGILMTGNGLIVQKAELSTDDYNCVFRNVLSLHKSSCWLLGDILLLGDRQWGNRYTESKYEEAMQATGLSRSTIRDIVMTCNRFPVEKRHPELSFSHHQEVAKSKAAPELREEVLNQAASENLSCSALRRQLKQTTFEQPPAEPSVEPPKGEAPDHLGLLELPERVAPDAPPLWDARKFVAWAEKQDTDDYTQEQCEAALNLTESIVAFHQRVLQRLETLKTSS